MSEIAGVNTASSIQADYMKLLVTELQNQNPLEPLSNNEMATQLAQFSQLQQIESLNSSFAAVLANIERTYATSLIGKEISFFDVSESGEQGIAEGVVDQVYTDVDGQIVLKAGGRVIGLEDVVSVKG